MEQFSAWLVNQSTPLPGTISWLLFESFAAILAVAGGALAVVVILFGIRKLRSQIR